jgi:hypothetical protein
MVSQTGTFGHSAKATSISPVACATAPTLSDWSVHTIEQVYTGRFPTADADIHARPLVRQSGQGKAGIFHGVISDLEQKPLLRIYRLGLTRADAEELGIESVDLI